MYTTIQQCSHSLCAVELNCRRMRSRSQLRPDPVAASLDAPLPFSALESAFALASSAFLNGISACFRALMISCSAANRASSSSAAVFAARTRAAASREASRCCVARRAASAASDAAWSASALVFARTAAMSACSAAAAAVAVSRSYEPLSARDGARLLPAAAGAGISSETKRCATTSVRADAGSASNIERHAPSLTSASKALARWDSCAASTASTRAASGAPIASNATACARAVRPDSTSAASCGCNARSTGAAFSSAM